MKNMVSGQSIPRTNHRAAVRHDSDSAFLKKVRNIYMQDVDADRHNIEPAREDIQFTIGDQWDPTVKARRNRLRKPCLTVNRLPAFVAQYVGSWLQTDTTVKLQPIRGGSKKVAEIRQGLIRSTLRQRTSKHALHTAAETAYICGIGNFGVTLEDAKNDVFVRDMCLETYDDPFQVIWDRGSREPTGADAQHCFVTKYMTKDDFKDAYPDAMDGGGWVADELDYTVMTSHGWEIDEMVRVCQFWQMRYERVTVGLETGTGDVIDLMDIDPDEWSQVCQLDEDGQPITRETDRPYAEVYVITSNEVLEGPYRLDVSRLPIFRVEGWVMQESSVRYRWGFVRNAKDPQRLHNYWRSILAEELMKSVSSKWLLDQTSMKNGLADHFRHAHTSDDNVLFWDSQADGAKPERVDPPLVNQAVLTEASMSVQDIKDVTNKHEASLGVQSNEVSGRAISARQRMSELGDVIYMENTNAAIAEAGRVMNELIPQVYDTNRVIKVTGDDDKEILQEINGDFGDNTPDITKGKYDITYDTGPSYATKRQEAVDMTMTLMNTMPQVGNLIADIIVRNMDIPGAEEIEERLAKMLPPGMLDVEKLPERRKQKILMQQKKQEAQQQKQEQIQDAQIQAALEKMSAEIQELMARANKQNAQAAAEPQRVEIDEFEAVTGAQIDAAKVQTQVDANELSAIDLGLQAALRTTTPEEKPNGPEDSESQEE